MASFSSSSRLAANTSAMVVNPVTFPPGRARLSTSPSATGSGTVKKTIGIVLVAFLAATVAAEPRHDDDINLESDQLISQGREPVEFIIRVSRLESDILALYIASLRTPAGMNRSQ